MVYKFRTMTVLEDGAEVRQATKDDKRITRVGGSCAGPRSTSCRSSSTCCRAA